MLSHPELVYVNAWHRQRPQKPTETDCGYKTPCLLEHGSITKGYVVLRRKTAPGVYSKKGAHVWAWMDANGREVPTGMMVHHKCHQPRCVNPDHLDLMTPAGNVREGRAAKINEDAVRDIRRDPAPAPVLAKRYGISPYTVRAIRKGQLWKGV